MMEKTTFVRRWGYVLADDTVEDFTAAPIIVRGLVAYDLVTASDETTKATLLMVGFKRGADEVYLNSQMPGAKGDLVTTVNRVFVSADYRPFVRVYGGTVGDKIVLCAYGYYTEVRD